MHIAHVLTRLQRAGSEENTFLSATAQRQAGHEISILYGSSFDPDVASDWARHFRMIEVPALVRPLHPFKDVAALLSLAGHLRRIRPDVLHTHQSKAGIVGRLAAGIARVPVVVHGVHIIPFEHVGPFQRALYLAAEKICARLTHGFVHVSENSRNAYLSHHIGVDVPHLVVRSGMALSRFRDAGWPDDWAALLGIQDRREKPLTLLLIAALETRKRHLELLDAIAASPDRPENFRLLLAGSGPLAAEIAMAVERLKLGTQVRLLGHRGDPECLIALSDACLSVAAREGLPRVVIQYLAGGRTAFVVRTMGLDSDIAAHPDCRVYEAQDLQRLVNDAFRHGAAGSSGSASGYQALAAWDVSRMAEGLDAAYDAAAGQSKRPYEARMRAPTARKQAAE